MFWKKKQITVVRFDDFGTIKGYLEREVSNGYYQVGETITFSDFMGIVRICKIIAIDHEESVRRSPKKTILHCIIVKNQNKNYQNDKTTD